MKNLFIRTDDDNHLQLVFVPSGQEKDIAEGVTIHPLGFDIYELNTDKLLNNIATVVLTTVMNIGSMEKVTQEDINRAMYRAIVKTMNKEKK